MKKATLKIGKVNDRRREQTSSIRSLPPCQCCNFRRADYVTENLISNIEIFICSHCLEAYGIKPKRKLKI